MYVFLYACMYVCMHARQSVCLRACMKHVYIDIFMDAMSTRTNATHPNACLTSNVECLDVSNVECRMSRRV